MAQFCGVTILLCFKRNCKNTCLHYNLPVQFHLIWQTMKALNIPPYPGRKFDFPQKIGKTWWWWCSMLFGVCCPPPLWGPSHSSGKSLLVVPSSVPKCSTKYCNPHSANFIDFAFVASPNTCTKKEEERTQFFWSASQTN